MYAMNWGRSAEASQVASLGYDRHRGQEADAADGLKETNHLPLADCLGAFASAASRRLTRSPAARTSAR
jgi:hypothetical protein